MKLFDYLIDWILPNRCGFCDSFTKWNELACKDCISHIELCDNYIREDRNRRFIACIFACEYEGAPKRGVLNLKYRQNTNAVKYLLLRLAENLKSSGIADRIDIVTAVPMNSSRFNETGYNHAQVVADAVAKSLKLSKNYKLLGTVRSKNTQHELTREERINDVKGKYFIKNKAYKKVYGKTVLLCDDIITTGSTLSECSRLLLNCGAKEVYCLTLASTPEKKEGS